MHNKIRILWADDEMELLKAHLLFLEEKGYEVVGVSNGYDALDALQREQFDVVFLDEHMPGLTGLELIPKIREKHPFIPVVMITKSEEENIMEEAIGSQIADYLIKPVKANQILLCLKRLIDNKRLVSEKTTSNYRQEFQAMLAELNNSLSADEWAELYKKMVYWELELDRSESREMQEIVAMQKQEAGNGFCKFVSKRYTDWMSKPDDKTPVLSHSLMTKKVLPYIDETIPTYFVLIDNLRYDQWKIIQPMLNTFTRTIEESHYFAILPTATQYARNALFAGLTPLDISKKFPDKWVNDTEEEGKNLHEEFFLQELLKRSGKNGKMSFQKITTTQHGSELVNNVLNLMGNSLNVIVYNFMDMLSHARTEMEVLKELAPDERAYRSITASWFEHSPLYEALKKLQGKTAQIIITTDHGSIRVNDATKVVGDRQTSHNLRYKTGKSLQYSDKDAFGVRKPEDIKLPSAFVSSEFIFAKEQNFLVYGNNFNQYANFYRNSFQHGGLSIEEMIVPFARLLTK